ncbi:hypothetical protein SRHO_G00223620 [Serrasalmus rhombeus]
MDVMEVQFPDECVETECFGSTTAETQDIYLRLDTRRRRSGLRLARLIARQQILQKIAREIEAKEACDWLRAAGFPQYAQLYEDSQFPIDISAVKKDHDFLDKDLVEPLCRRLNTLNKCASMKLDVGFPKKRSEDSDEDDLLAISSRWTFERSSRRWSRMRDIDLILGGADGRSPSQGPGLRTTVSSESVLTDLSEPEICSLHSEDSLSIMPDSISLAHLSIAPRPASLRFTPCQKRPAWAHTCQGLPTADGDAGALMGALARASRAPINGYQWASPAESARRSQNTALCPNSQWRTIKS